jgi:DNA-binding protein H-NS
MNLETYTLPQLKQLSARISKEIAKQESANKVSVLKKLKQMAREHGLSLEDVVGDTSKAAPLKTPQRKAAAVPRAPVPVKYRHPSNTELAWSGRGRKPRWVESWVANGGAMDGLETAAQKFDKKEQRKAKAATEVVGIEPAVEGKRARTTETAADAE